MAVIDPQPSCLLFKLPPELRNYIYELIFATPDTIDFVDACSPPKDLVLTCRRLHTEMTGLYKEAYRAYWSETTFEIDMFLDKPKRTERDPSTKTRRPKFTRRSRTCATKTSRTYPMFTSRPPRRTDSLSSATPPGTPVLSIFPSRTHRSTRPYSSSTHWKIQALSRMQGWRPLPPGHRRASAR